MLLLFFLAGCQGAAQPASSATSRVPPSPVVAGAPSQTQRLRVHNSSAYALQHLTVFFPQDKVSFGNVPAGATTGYRDVPHGVYAYAAYALELDGKNIEQAVVDWIGEAPLPGDSFTYRILADPDLYSRNRAIQLIQVTKD